MLENGKMGCLRRVFEVIFEHNVINRHFFRGIRGHFFNLIRGHRPANLDPRVRLCVTPVDDCRVMQLGRSMIEMLGVLAIIGVLSVGGIAGYSKAMEMWKISKQKQQIAELFIQTINLKEYFMREYNKTQAYVSTAYIMNTIGVIPDGMEMVDDYNIQDSAGNNIRIYFNSWNHKANGLEYMLMFDIFQPNMSKRQMQNYCATFLEQSQAIAPYILNVTKRNYATENGNTSGYTVDYFNFYSATPSDIYNFCKSCSSKYGCTLLLKFKL